MIAPVPYMHLQLLPAGCGPVLVERGAGWVLLIVDLAATRVAALTAMLDLLTDAEQDAYRAAFGLGPKGTPLRDRWLADDLVCPWLPPSVRLKTYDLPDRRQDSEARELWAALYGETQDA